MKTTTTFKFGFIGFFAVMLVSFLLNGLLGISGFEKTYKESLVSQYSIQGETLKGRIETALNLGKRLYLLDNQIDEFFYELMRLSSGISHIYISDASDTILYSTRTVLNQNKVPFNFTHGSDLENKDQRPPTDTIKFLDAYYICIPLYSDETIFQGTLILEFPEELISTKMIKTAQIILQQGLPIFFIALILYMGLFFAFGKYPRAEAIITIILMIGSQSLFTVQNFSLYNKSITDIFGRTMTVQAKSLAEDFQKMLDYSIKLESMGGVQEYLDKRLQNNPQCSAAYITDINMSILYRQTLHIQPEKVKKSRALLNIEMARLLSRQDNDLTILPLTSEFGNGYLALRINRDLINSILADMALDSTTVIIVALLFAFILKDFLILISVPASLHKAPTILAQEEPEKALNLIKISTFLFMFAAFETLSFIPLYIQQIYQKNPFILWGMSGQTIISLPLGSYMLGIMFAMLLTIFVLKKLSIKLRYIIMTIAFIIGSILTMNSDSFVFLVIARLIAGFGFGGVLLSTSSLVMTYTSEESRSQGFGTNAAAFAAASICSIPIGGIIVHKFGYHAGIWISIGFAVLFLLFSIFYVSDSATSGNTQASLESRKSIKFKDFMRILGSRHILIYLIFINIPFQLIYVGLFQFILPLYMQSDLGLSQGNIGRILTIFSIVSLSAAWVSRLSDHLRKDKYLIAFGAFVVGIMLIVFKLYPEGGLLLFVALMIAMGIDNVFIDAIEEVYVSAGNLKHISDEDLLQSYKTIEKIISVLIPTITGYFFMQIGFSASLLYIGIWSALGAIAFVLLGKNGRWEKKIDEKK